MNRLRFKVRVQFQTHRNRRLAMTAWDALANPQTVIANVVKQSMSQSLRRGEVVGFRQGAAWISTPSLTVLSMNRLRFKVRVQFQTHRNRRLTMTV